MGDPRGFIKFGPAKAPERPVAERVSDYRETSLGMPSRELRDQASRCMDCGIPFCHSGCPLGNLIPEWNDHMYRGRADDAAEALRETNNFPEITGRVCPAPCEAACVLNIENTPVSIKAVERAIADHIFERGLRPEPALTKTGRRVAVIGSGPAGLAAAQQLARHGHEVVVYERDDRIGGLLRYGIPDFKLDKHVLDTRLEQLVAEGVDFKTGVNAGVDVTGDELRRKYDAVILAGGARQPRDLPVPGRELQGVHFAMEFLEQQNRRVAGDIVPEAGAILATGKHVVVIGGGDTGSDCVGTSNRHRAQSVSQIELLPKPGSERPLTNPWPEWPQILRTSTSHEEGCVREFSMATKRLVGDEHGRVRALEAVRVKLEAGKVVELPGEPIVVPAELVLLAMGFVGAEKSPLLQQLGVELTARQAVASTPTGATNVPGVFAAGDMSRGQSLVVWAIADGRRVAAGVDAYLRKLDRAGRAA